MSDVNLSFYEYFISRVLSSERCLSFYGRTFTGKEVAARVNGVANAFSRLGVKKGDVVAINLPNSPECVFSIYALNKIGATVFVTHPLLPTHALEKELKEAGASFLICRVGFGKELSVKRITCNLVGYFSPVKRGFLKFFARNFEKPTYPYSAIGEARVENAESRGEDVALYLPSGGTTGEPKIIKITNAAFNKNAEATVSLAKIPLASEGVLLVLPFYHGFGLSSSLHGAVSGGAEGVILPYFDVKKSAKYVKKGKVSIILGVPNMFRKLLENKDFLKGIGNMVLAFSGGDSLPEKLKARYDERAMKAGSESRLYQGYGLAETVSVCAACSKGEDKLGSIGKPVEAKIRIVREDGSEAKSGEIGEIAVSTDCMMEGYLGSSDTRSEFLLTGDLGYRDEEGFFFFTGRKKRVIVIGGMNVYPVEIERAAMDVGFLTDAAAVGYTENGKTKIALFCTDDSEYSEEIKAQKIREVLSQNVIRYAFPSEIVFLKEMPKTEIGKKDYALLDKIASKRAPIVRN